MKLTELEWFTLCSAYAEREENLRVRAEEQGEKGLGHEIAALNRAMDKVRAELAPPVGGQRVRRRRP